MHVKWNREVFGCVRDLPVIHVVVILVYSQVNNTLTMPYYSLLRFSNKVRRFLLTHHPLHKNHPWTKPSIWITWIITLKERQEDVTQSDLFSQANGQDFSSVQMSVIYCHQLVLQTASMSELLRFERVMLLKSFPSSQKSICGWSRKERLAGHQQISCECVAHKCSAFSQVL